MPPLFSTSHLKRLLFQPRLVSTGHAIGLILACALLSAPGALAQAMDELLPPMDQLPEGIQAITLIQGVAEYRLDNGLQILLAPDPARSRTTVNMSYRVGSRHEGPGETGMAHLLEHLLFRGSPHFPDALAEFSRRGLAANGSTSVDMTNYYATFNHDPDTLRWYLGWQADAMQHNQILQKDLDAEMTVVRNEMERGENSPFGVLLQQTTSAAYVWHPYGRSVIGARSDVENVHIDSLRAFYHRYYQPDNATLIITGDFNPRETLQWIAEAFSTIPRPSRQLPAEYTQEPVQQGPRSVTIQRPGGSPIVLALYHTPAATSSHFTALSAGVAMLADSPAGPLHQRLVVNGQANSVFGFARSLNQPGYALFGARLNPDADAQAVLGDLLETLETQGIGQLDEAALVRIQTAWSNQWKQVWNQSSALASALSNAVGRGDWRLFFVEPLQIEALQLETVQTELRRWLLPSNRTSGLYLPTASPVDAPQPQATDFSMWLDKLQTGTGRPRLPAFDISSVGLDAATERTILHEPNGSVRLALLPKPVAGARAQVNAALRFGQADQLRDLKLTPLFLGNMLLRGTPSLSRQQIEDRLNEMDADLDFSLSGNRLNLTMDAPREHLGAVLALAFDLLKTSDFPEDELDQLRRSLIGRIKDQSANPSWLVRNALQRHDQRWPEDDIRYTPTAEQLWAWARDTTREDLLRFHDTFIGPGDILLSAVGDFDPEELKAGLQDALQGWKQAPAYQRLDDPYHATSPDTFRIPAPGKINAEYLAMQPVPLQDTDPRWPALVLANYLLGGSEDSRLWQAVRVRKGLSYGVGSSLQASAYEPSGAWMLYASAAADNAPALMQAIHSTVRDTLATGFTQEEVTRGARSLSQFMQMGRSSEAWLAAQWLHYLATGRSFAWQQAFLDRLDALTADEVNQAMREVLDPDGFSQAVAGDFQPDPDTATARN